MNDNSVRYNTSYNKHKSREIFKANYDENTHLLLGSSELSVANKKNSIQPQMFNYDDFHLMEVGGGFFLKCDSSINIGFVRADYDTEESGYYREFNLVWSKKDGTKMPLKVGFQKSMYITLWWIQNFQKRLN